MATAVYLPKIGMTMEEGTLTKWVVPEGGEVKRGEVLFEMETEKVQMEVEAEADGILRRLVAEDTKLKPGDIVGALLAPGEALPAAFQQAAAALAAGTENMAGGTAAAPPPAMQPPQGSERIVATPVARRLASENGIDLAALQGSGPGGRIVEADVRTAIETLGARTAAAVEPPAVAPAGPAVTTPPAVGSSIAYTGRRRTIGERMHASLRDAAQLTLVSEVSVDAAMAMVYGLNREWRSDRVAVTLTALAVRALALAAREHPAFNARLDGDAIILSTAVNVGLAVNLEEGLMVPVIRDVDVMSLKDVATRVRALTESARDGKLGVDDLTGGTITLTSLEGSGVDAFTPVLNPPQAAILGAGRVREIAAFEGPNVVRRQVTTLSLTFDHRIADGGPAARFLDRIAELLSRPYMLM
jgi:pyruvate dehydrogenase E2 component (dihydrolipoamide acetyltransferase)